MALQISWQLLFGAVVAYYGSLVFYRLFLHPLAQFPGPRLAAISRWYEAYFDVVLPGQYTFKIAELHRRYGPIIRISPHELHVIDPTFFETLYRSDGRWDKYAWSTDAFGAKHATIFSSDHDAHRVRRRAIAPFFSKAKVAARQDVLHRNLEKLCRRITELVGSTVNLGAAVSAYTRDNASEYVINKTYNELDSEDFGIGLSIVSGGGGVFWRTTKHIRWFGPTLKAVPIDWIMKTADEGTRAFLMRLQISEQDTRDIMAASKPLARDDGVPDTMIETILGSDLPPSEKLFDRVNQEVATVSGAASETTASALRLILFHVFSNDEIRSRLREEISPIAAQLSEPTAWKKLEQLPYLTATLTEGMRLSPAIGSRMARITDKDLFYGKWRIPAGTPVGMTLILMHTDPDTYPDPMRFDPDRWLDPTARAALGPKFAPFSRGTRNCLGMHLAWAEMYLVLATLVHRFHFTIKDAVAEDFELAQDNFAIGTKAGVSLLAGVALCDE